MQLRSGPEGMMWVDVPTPIAILILVCLMGGLYLNSRRLGACRDYRGTKTK